MCTKKCQLLYDDFPFGDHNQWFFLDIGEIFQKELEKTFCCKAHGA